MRDGSGALRGVEAVVDKDLTAAVLGRSARRRRHGRRHGRPRRRPRLGTPHARPIGTIDGATGTIVVPGRP